MLQYFLVNKTNLYSTFLFYITSLEYTLMFINRRKCLKVETICNMNALSVHYTVSTLQGVNYEHTVSPKNVKM